MASLSRPYSKKIIIILLHIIVWILFFSVPLLLRSPFDNRRLPEIMLHPPHFNLFHTLRDIMMVGIFYLNAYLFLPQVINEKKFNRFILWQLLLFLPFILLNKLFFDWLIGFSLRPNNTMARIIFFRDFLPYLLMLASSTAYRMIIDRIRVERITKERENENLKTELLLLRSQISPHFMFNILNNMVSLARKKSDQLEPSLIKLSFLMRYIFYEVREDKVPLQKEIEYIQSYIDIQEQRFSGGVVVKTDIQCCPENYLI
ncbi:MAG: sensor histidine kinase, partial [Chitinophagaceae bacterium]